MKKILLYGLLLSIASILFAQQKMQVWQNGVPTSFTVVEVDSITFTKETPMISDPGFESLTILKLNKPEYKDYILTNQFDEYFCIHPSSKYLPDGCWENMQGRCPFHELKQGYVLVDWRWTSWFAPVILF